MDDVPDPVIQEPTDAIVRITSTALCGSDLHPYEVLAPFMDGGDVLGHEPMGIVEAVGSEVTSLLQAIAYADVPPSGSLVVLGLGPIGDMSTRIAQLRGAGTVIGIDLVPERLDRSRLHGVDVGCSIRYR